MQNVNGSEKYVVNIPFILYKTINLLGQQGVMVTVKNLVQSWRSALEQDIELLSISASVNWGIQRAKENFIIREENSWGLLDAKLYICFIFKVRV